MAGRNRCVGCGGGGGCSGGGGSGSAGIQSSRENIHYEKEKEACIINFSDDA